jgi:hypothetical protein
VEARIPCADPDGTQDRFRVFNENTGAEALAKGPATQTNAIDDASTVSHACMQNPAAGEFNMPKTCTGDF